MRNAETVLGVIRERGKRGLPLEDIYRQLFNRELYLLAYSRLYSNSGALTRGITNETVDGMSLAKIDDIISDLRQERYRWQPVRRTYIPKKNGKFRPLGIPSWSNKLLQEVMRSILEAYYEPQFSIHSHGFRPHRGCHTALAEVTHGWTGTVWYVEGDIAHCFDGFDHEVLLAILGEKLHDNRFLRLIQHLLKAGYLEDWKFNSTLSGTPQGGVISPILSNVYLDRLDKFVEQVLLPRYNHGAQRRKNPEYWKLSQAAWYREKIGRHDEAKTLRQQSRQLPVRDPHDPDFRRLHYVRYADDFLLGFIGTRNEAEEIKCQLMMFLQDKLKLELSETKTLITHGRKEAARFLGYEIVTLHDDHKIGSNGARSINGHISLKVPVDVIKAKCQPYMQHEKPCARPERRHDSAFSIVSQYQAEYRGIVQYYQLAYNLHRFSRLKGVMEQSLTMTLAGKFRTSVRWVYEKYQALIKRDGKTYKGLRVIVERGKGKTPLVAEWGGIPLCRQQPTKAVLDDQPPRVWNVGTELVQRLLADTCELCGSEEEVQVHHVRALKDLQPQRSGERPEWVKVMIARHRKTLVVCRKCHQAIHDGTNQRGNQSDQMSGR